jgi:hypothetical protein
LKWPNPEVDAIHPGLMKTLILPRKQNKTTSFYWAQVKSHNGSKLAAKEAVKAYNIPWFPA